ncbi:MAG: ABC-2 family transporter protein [Phycisphaeraceae bacterium]|nr:ABC-2 family transporter protein [Phycisphaeraceae bacterium]
MTDVLYLYGRYIGVSVRGQMQYPVTFVVQSLGILLVTGMEFVGIWAMFDRFGNLRGWTLPQIAFLYGLVSVTFAFADAMARGFDMFSGTVRRGDFDRILARPRSTVLQLAGQELTLRRVGRLAQGLTILTWAVLALDLTWSAPTAGLLLLTIVGGVCLFSGLVVLQATMCFWTTESLEVWNAFTYGGVVAAQYPLNIYRAWFRQFLTCVVPVACVTYFPALAMMDRADPLGSPRWFQCVAPLAGPIFMLIALQAWRVGVRHYTSTGS